MSSAESVVSFSIIMAEVFAAVGISTAVPAAVVAGMKAGQTGLNALSTAIQQMDEVPATVKNGVTILAEGANNVDSIDIMMPKTARIHSEFAFQGTFSVAGNVSGGGGASIQSLGAVSVSAGYSALYESSSQNKITLDIDFVTVNVPLN